MFSLNDPANVGAELVRFVELISSKINDNCMIETHRIWPIDCFDQIRKSCSAELNNWTELKLNGGSSLDWIRRRLMLNDSADGNSFTNEIWSKRTNCTIKSCKYVPARTEMNGLADWGWPVVAFWAGSADAGGFVVAFDICSVSIPTWRVRDKSPLKLWGRKSSNH